MIKTICKFSVIATVASLGAGNAFAHNHEHQENGGTKGSFYIKALVGMIKQLESPSVLKVTGHAELDKIAEKQNRIAPAPSGAVAGFDTYNHKQEITNDTLKYNYDWSFTGGAYIGYALNKGFSFEVGYDYLSTEIEKATYDYQITVTKDKVGVKSPTANGTKVDSEFGKDSVIVTEAGSVKNANSNDIGKFKAHLISVNAIYDFNKTSDDLAVYAGAGLLMFMNPELETKTKISGTPSLNNNTYISSAKYITRTFKKDGDVVFGFRGLVGVKYKASEEADVILEARYQRSLKMDLSNQAANSKEVLNDYEYVDMSVLAGVQFKF